MLMPISMPALERKAFFPGSYLPEWLAESWTIAQSNHSALQGAFVGVMRGWQSMKQRRRLANSRPGCIQGCYAALAAWPLIETLRAGRHTCRLTRSVGAKWLAMCGTL